MIVGKPPIFEVMNWGKKVLSCILKINLRENCGNRHIGMRSVWVLIWTARQDVKEGE